MAILKAKKFEFEALVHTNADVADKLAPLFEIGRLPPDKAKWPQWLSRCSMPVAAYLDRITDGIANAWAGRLALVDAYQWAADAQTEYGSHVISYAISRLRGLGIPVVPVVGYDRWENEIYRLSLQGVQPHTEGHYCIRLDSHAIEDVSDPDYFLENIAAIIDGLDIDPSRCTILIDFGDVTTIAIEGLIAKASAIITLLSGFNFFQFIPTGCSIPKTIDLAVKKHDASDLIVRREALLWKALRGEFPGLRILYGDYGVRGPNTNDGTPSKHTNGKIRYTINQQTFVVRGHSFAKDGSGVQMHSLANTVASSSHYLGTSFSWGDMRLSMCRNGMFTGSAGTWIAIDTNHHLAHVMHEIEEFERRFVPASVAV